MKEKDLEHLRLMLDFAKRVERRILGISIDEFLKNEDLQDMTLYAIGQVGENASAISDITKDKHPEVFWGAVVGIRNRVFHSYGAVDMSIVYEAAADHMPVLVKQITNIINAITKNKLDSI